MKQNKKYQKIFNILQICILLHLLTLVIFISLILAENIVRFADPELEKAVKGSLRVCSWNRVFCEHPQISEEQPITTKDMEKLIGCCAGWGTSHHLWSDWIKKKYKMIKSLNGLEYAINLKTLIICSAQITDISPIANLKNLEFLQLNENEIRDLSPLKKLSNLNGLYLGQNRITDISPLKDLIKLKDVDLSRNEISNMEPLKNLTNLSGLFLMFNRITDISPLENLTNLVWLDLSGNLIKDISPLKNLTKLKTLYLYGNLITDISPLVANKGLGPGSSVDIRLNLLDLTPGSKAVKDIQALQARGVKVLYQPQKSEMTFKLETGLTIEEFLNPKNDWQIERAKYISKIHWPRGYSGVTIGAGYDLGQRDRDEIIETLVGIGVPSEIALNLANAAGLKGENARKFVEKYKNEYWAKLPPERILYLFSIEYYKAWECAKDGVNNATEWLLYIEPGKKLFIFQPCDKQINKEELFNWAQNNFKPLAEKFQIQVKDVTFVIVSSCKKFEELPLPAQEVAADMAYNLGCKKFKDQNWGGIFQINDWKLAADYLEGKIKGYAYDPKVDKNWLSIESIFKKWGNQTQSRIKNLAEALRNISDSTALLNYNEAYKRALEYMNKGMYDQAISELNSVIKVNPNLQEAYRLRGWAYYKKGKQKVDNMSCLEMADFLEKENEFKKAILDFTQAIKLNHGDAEAYCGRGWTYLE
jgi:tetratricopeptide (TPR) repeat protein